MVLAPSSILEFCQQFGKRDVWIALSGGLDSIVLLDLCHAIKAQIPGQFRVVHVHHGLSPHAEAWTAHNEQQCLDYGFDFHLAKVKLQRTVGESLEEVAREARYQVFADLLQADDLLLTAHHQDDQAETLLLQLLRGAGPKGLSAMPAIKSFAQGFHGRPLLSFSRAVLAAYAEEKNLKWIDDESNASCSFSRNYIRHAIMPLLKSRWPSVEASLSRSAAHCAETQLLLDEVASLKLLAMQGVRPHTLSATSLLAEPPAWQRLLLRTWIQQQGCQLPDTDTLASIQQSVLASAYDRTPEVSWEETSLRRHGDDIYLLSPANRKQTLVPGIGLKPEIGALTIRNRIPGETVEVAKRGRVSLKNLFQEWQVPPWERSELPLLFCDNKLIEVPGYYQDAAYFL